MKRLRGGLMVAFIFLCGFLVGGFLGLAVGSVGFFHKIVEGGPGAIREVVMKRATNDLKLKPEQRIRVQKIVDETGAELATTTAEVRPKVEEIIGRSEDRIREGLDVKQRLKFDRLVNEGRRLWKASVAPRATPAPEQKGAPASPPPSHPERSEAQSKDL